MQFSQITISCPVVFSWISLTVWNLFPFKGDFSFWKSQKLQGTKCGLEGGWVTWVIWCVTKNSVWDMTHEWVCCHDKAANHQVPIAMDFWIIRIVSMEECSSLTQNLMQIHCSTHSVILNVMATEYGCSLNGEPIRWSHCHICTFQSTLHGCQFTLMSCKPVLIILTMAGLFLDRTCTIHGIQNVPLEKTTKTWDFNYSTGWGGEWSYIGAKSLHFIRNNLMLF